MPAELSPAKAVADLNRRDCGAYFEVHKSDNSKIWCKACRKAFAVKDRNAHLGPRHTQQVAVKEQYIDGMCVICEVALASERLFLRHISRDSHLGALAMCKQRSRAQNTTSPISSHQTLQEAREEVSHSVSRTQVTVVAVDGTNEFCWSTAGLKNNIVIFETQTVRHGNMCYINAAVQLMRHVGRNLYESIAAAVQMPQQIEAEEVALPINRGNPEAVHQKIAERLRRIKVWVDNRAAITCGNNCAPLWRDLAAQNGEFSNLQPHCVYQLLQSFFDCLPAVHLQKFHFREAFVRRCTLCEYTTSAAPALSIFLSLPIANEVADPCIQSLLDFAQTTQRTAIREQTYHADGSVKSAGCRCPVPEPQNHLEDHSFSASETMLILLPRFDDINVKNTRGVMLNKTVTVAGVLYDLAGVISHRGNGATSGHYIYSKTEPSTTRWTVFNDAAVSENLAESVPPPDRLLGAFHSYIVVYSTAAPLPSHNAVAVPRSSGISTAVSRPPEVAVTPASHGERRYQAVADESSLIHCIFGIPQASGALKYADTKFLRAHLVSDLSKAEADDHAWVHLWLEAKDTNKLADRLFNAVHPFRAVLPAMEEAFQKFRGDDFKNFRRLHCAALAKGLQLTIGHAVKLASYCDKAIAFDDIDLVVGTQQQKLAVAYRDGLWSRSSLIPALLQQEVQSKIKCMWGPLLPRFQTSANVAAAPATARVAIDGQPETIQERVEKWNAQSGKNIWTVKFKRGTPYPYCAACAGFVRPEDQLQHIKTKSHVSQAARHPGILPAHIVPGSIGKVLDDELLEIDMSEKREDDYVEGETPQQAHLSFEHDIEAAVKHFYDCAGRTELDKHPNLEPVGNIELERVHAFRAAMKTYAEEVTICGVCACRNSFPVKMMTFNELSCLQAGIEGQTPAKCSREFRFHFDFNGETYWVYPDGVSGSEVRVCPDCHRNLKKLQRPEYSLASGWNFVDTNRLQLPALTPMEEIAISIVVPFATIISINGGKKSPLCVGNDIKFTGHCISFPVEHSTYTKKLPRSAASVRECVEVIFVGTEEVRASMNSARKARNVKYAQISVRENQCLRWLNFLKEHNPLYADVEINPLWEQALENLPEVLVDQALSQPSSKAAVVQHAIATSGPASEEYSLPHDVPPLLEHCLIGGGQPRRVDIRTQMIHSIADRMDGVKHFLGLPMNEYEENNRLIVCAFPQHFTGVRMDLLPNSIWSGRATERLLTFADGRFQNPRLIFLLFDQKQRAQTNSGVKCYIKSSHADEKVLDLLNSEKFKKKIEKAKAGDEKAIQSVTAQMSHFVMGCGKNVEWSAMQRRSAISNIYAEMVYRGIPLFFVTISPADNDQQATLNLSHGFPGGDGLNCPLHLRRSTVASNPVAATLVYHKIIAKVIEILIGLTPSVKKSTVPSRTRGLFGQPVSVSGVHEAQGRGSLHFHFLLWAMMSPEFISKCANNSEVMILICAAVDSVVQAHLPQEFQKPRDTSDGADRFSAALQPCPEIEDREAFNKFTNTAAQACQLHIPHKATCWKNPRYPTCRVARPQPMKMPSTGLSTIEIEDESGWHSLRDFRAERREDKCPKAIKTVRRTQLIEPLKTTGLLAKVDERLLIFELMRGDGDGYVAEFSPGVTAATGGNNNVQLTGAWRQARAAAAYICPYVTKDCTALANLVGPLKAASDALQEAYKTRKQDPSLDGKLVLQRLLHQTTAKTEHSVQMCVSSILDIRGEFRTSKFAFLFAQSATKYLKKLPAPTRKRQKTRRSESDNESEDPDSDEYEVEENGDCVDDDDNEGKKWGERKELDSAVTGEIVLAAQQHTHYALRGEYLQKLSLYEHVGVLEVTKKKAGDWYYGDKKPTHDGAGRPQNLKFHFHALHPQHATHCQKIRSNFTIPMFVQGRPPTDVMFHDGTPSRNLPRRCKKQRRRVAEFISTVFVPWTPEDGARVISSTFADVVSEVDRWEKCGGTSAAKAAIVRSAAMGLKDDGLGTKAMQMHRFSCADTMANREALKQTADRLGVLEIELEKTIKESRQMSKLVAEDHAGELYIALSLAFLDTCFGVTTEAQLSRLPAFPLPDQSYVFVPPSPMTKTFSSIPDSSSDEEEPHQQPTGTHTNMFSLLSEPVDGLNQDQENAYRECRAFVLGPRRHSILLIHGGPGTGKTTLVKALVRRLRAEEGKHALLTATTGVAATLIPDCQTYHSAFHINPRWQQRISDTTKISKAQIALAAASYTVLDEVSMIGKSGVHKIDVRLRQFIGKSEAAFSGHPMIFVGDFFQLTCVHDIPLYAEQLESGKKTAENFFNTFADGAIKLVELKVSMRAQGDNVLSSILTQMRNSNTYETAIRLLLDRVQYLTRKDFNDDFAFAPIIVASNRERRAINEAQLRRYAVLRSQPFLMIRLEHEPDTLGAKDPEAIFYFSRGAPAMFLENSREHPQLANGTLLELVAIEFPGPVAVDAEGYVRPDVGRGFAVKVQIKTELKSVGEPTTFTIQIAGKTRTELHGVEVLHCPVCLAFSLTFYKCQGCTLNRAILDLNKRSGGLHKIDFASVYVGLSRVRELGHIRLFGPRNLGGLVGDLLNITVPDKIEKFLSRLRSSNRS